MDGMENKHRVRLGAVQETLFIPLAARARETQRKHPLLRDVSGALYTLTGYLELERNSHRARP